MKGNIVKRNGKRVAQSIVKVPKELIKLQQDVELAIDCFFANRHIILTTISTKICFTMVTHLAHRNKTLVWEALHATYKMYLLRGFRIVVIAVDQEFASISDLVVQLPTAPKLDWAAASQHCGLIERNIRFLKEKICSLCHSLPFERVPGIMVVRMVLHTVKFVNGFPRRGGLISREIMTDCQLNANDLKLSFGVYCQVAENVEPRNSLAPRTRAAISLGNSGNLSGGQMFFALDTGHTITLHQWVFLPMLPTVIARVNLFGKDEPSILTFTDRHGREIGDHTQDYEPSGNDDDSVVKLILDVIPGVDPPPEDDAELPGVDTDFDAEPTGVEVVDSDYVLPELTEVNGLGQQDTRAAPTEEPSDEPITAPAVTHAPSPKKGMSARNARNRKQPEKYVPSIKGNKYVVALTQIAASLKGSKHAMSMAQMSVKCMSKGAHRKADVVDMIMAQLSMKAAIKKWGQEAEYAITKEMKQLHWRDLYKPKHWHELTKKQKEQILDNLRIPHLC